jgi:dephospho-CoA kinase
MNTLTTSNFLLKFAGSFLVIMIFTSRRLRLHRLMSRRQTPQNHRRFRVRLQSRRIRHRQSTKAAPGQTDSFSLAGLRLHNQK